jgi:hypothetical protein
MSMSSATHDTVGANLDTDVQDAILEIRDIDRLIVCLFYRRSGYSTEPEQRRGANADGPETLRRHCRVEERRE